LSVVALRSVSRSFPGRSGPTCVLVDISMEIEPGEIVGLVGHNGVGKSTLAAIVAGLDDGYEGLVLRDEGAARAPMIFQDYRSSLLPWLSIIDNIAFPLTLQGIPRLERLRRVQELLEQSPKRLDVNKPTHSLSGGQSQLVAILRALITCPSLIVCDEPFSALDAEAEAELVELLPVLLPKYGTAALFISHDIEETQRTCDRLLVLGGAPATIVADFSVPTAGTKKDLQFSASAAEQRRAIMLKMSGNQ
jgi:NitT/TauT family transport system ATP-binding protein